MEDDAVVGVTSNPTIFQKALAEGDAYDEQLREEIAKEPDDTEVFLQLATRDVSDACDLLRPVWDRGGGRDGYVSIEVTPTSPTTPRAPSPRLSASTSGSTSPTCSSRSPPPSRAFPRSRR
jgi:transaldolase